MTEQNTQNLDLRSYRTYGMPLLGLLALVSAAGIVLTIIANFFF